MKMVKSLLLGSAAGLVAVVGAQAADLPVKAAPVQYVKICNLYGDGFFYIPGTDTCMKIAGLVWYELGYGDLSGGAQPAYFGQGGAHDRSSQLWQSRIRDDIDIDARTQTSYGTLRSFIRWRFEAVSIQGSASQGTGQNTVGEGTISPTVPRGFIQWAGFTFGRSKSLGDGVANHSDFRLLTQCQACADTVGGGINEVSYTWELGNGHSFSVGVRDRSPSSLTNLSNGGVNVGVNPPTTPAGGQPDPLVAYRVAQVWGDAAITAVGHNNQATYYTFDGCGAGKGTTFCGHPDDKFGWGVTAGAKINIPWLGAGDRFGIQFVGGEGFMKQDLGNNVNGGGIFGAFNKVSMGFVTDAVYINGGGLQLTTGWSFVGHLEHWWTPNLSTVLWGDYSEIKYNDTVVNNRLFCGTNNGFAVGPGVTCDPSFQFAMVGLTTSWYVTKAFRLALEVSDTFVFTAFKDQAVTISKTPGLIAPSSVSGPFIAKDQNVWNVIFRAQRNFGNDII